MVESVNLNINLIKNCIKTEQWKTVVEYLHFQFTIIIGDKMHEPIPLSVTQQTIDSLRYLIEYLTSTIALHSKQGPLSLASEVYRSLRNCCVHNVMLQNTLVSDQQIMLNSASILHSLLNTDKDIAENCIKMILQFLTNAVVQNKRNAQKVWEIFSNDLRALFEKPKFSNQVAALIYNCAYLCPDIVKYLSEVYERTIDNCTSDAIFPNDYLILLLELFAQELFFYEMYEKFEPSNKIALLTFIVDSKIMKKIDDFIIPPDAVPFLAKQFKKKSDSILKTVTNDVNEIEPTEVVLLLDVLASLSAEDCYLDKLKADKSLLINCAFLLRSIHDLGKKSQNNFTAVQKLSEVTSTETTFNKDPTFGFKANIIRLLGNLCWKNRINQDELRELDIIPLLLDCCNIDARNPFIIQGTILAIRNLCENNVENQAVIAGMNRQGVVDSFMLREMGLVLNDDGTSKIGIVPLEDIKKQ